MGRARACAAIFENGKIAMVKMEVGENSYWTLPGGGIERGESPKIAAIREAREEAGMEIRIIRPLFTRRYEAGIEYCYLAVPLAGARLKLGFDPELARGEQVLTAVAWKDVGGQQNDLQVEKVLAALSAAEFTRFKIRGLKPRENTTWGCGQ